MSWNPEERAHIKLQLEQVLASSCFSASNQLQRLLRYLVEETLAGRGDQLNQGRIAIDVLGKDARFDAATDSTVRVEAGRLRSRLIEYYYGDGQQDSIRFDLPKGHYAMKISFKGGLDSSDVAESAGSDGTLTSGLESSPPRDSKEKLSPTLLRPTLIGVFAGALLLVLMIAYTFLYKNPADIAVKPIETPADQSAGVYKNQPDESIAVLLFDSWGADSLQQNHISLGLTDDILTNLSRISTLRVTSRASSMRYKTSDKSLKEIGNELGVKNILEGSIRYSGNRIKVTAQLIRVADDSHLWANDYVREIDPGDTEYFEVTGEIARSIAHNLHVTISKEEEQRIGTPITDSPEAYDLYARARFLMTDDRTADEINRAAKYLRRALELDPEFAHAHAELADAYEWLIQVDNRQNDPGAWEEMQKHVQTAMQLDPNLAKPYVTMGLTRLFNLDFSGARQSLEKAIALDNSLAMAHTYYSMLLSMFGEHAKAIYHGKLVTELDPLDAQSWVGGLAFRYLSALDPQNAISTCKHALTLNEDYWGALWVMGMAYSQLGEHARAIELYERAHRISGGIDDLSSSMAYSYARHGETKKARDIIEQFEQNGVSPVLQAVAYVGLGENEQALSLLETALEQGDKQLWYVPGGFFFYLKPLIHEPRYQAFWRQLNLQDSWQRMVDLVEQS